jgi:hypothetical protein
MVTAIVLTPKVRSKIQLVFATIAGSQKIEPMPTSAATP